MTHAWFHAHNSARKFGGKPEDYLAIHEWFDQTKKVWADTRHRAVLHSSFGILLSEQVFGVTLTRLSDGREVPTRLIGEQHIMEDLGLIPTIQDWLDRLPYKPWMVTMARPLCQELKSEESLQDGKDARTKPMTTDARS